MESSKETSCSSVDVEARWMLKAEAFPPPYIHPILRVVIYTVITGIIGCSFIGWSGVQELLYKAGTFANLCNKETATTIHIRSSVFVDCPARKEAIKQLFTIAFSTNIFLCIFTGIILDYLGQRFCFVLGCFINFFCWVFLGFYPTNGPLVQILFFVMGLSAECVYLPLTTAALYFPKHKALILSIFSAFRTIALTVPNTLSYIYLSPKFDVEDFHVIIISYALIAYLGSGIVGLFIVQKNFFDTTHNNSENPEECSNEIKQTKTASLPINKIINSLTKGISKFQMPEIAIFGVSSSLFMAAVQMINNTHREIFVTTKGQSAIEYFRYGHILSFIPGLLIGFLVDLIGSAKSFLIMQVCLLLSSIIIGFDAIEAKITGCVLYTIGSSIFLSIIILYVYENYPPERVGVVLGFVLLFCGTAVVANIPLYKVVVNEWSKERRYLKLSYILIAYVSVSIVTNGATVYLRHKTKGIAKKNDWKIEKESL